MENMINKPYFTIFVPCYNRAYIINRNLDSLVKQSFKNFEVLIVDDGSTDNTEEIVNYYIDNSLLKIRYFHKENGGKHSALNIGFEKAAGIFFIILDSDDWLADDALNVLSLYCKKIENNPEFSGVMGKWATDKGNVLGKLFPDSAKEMSYFDMHFGLGREMGLLDSFDCNKTEILRNYRFPIDRNTHFVPEAYVFDQIGVKYKMLCFNEIIGYKEMLDDGISKDTKYKRKNNIGFLYHYISRIENVFKVKNPGLKWKVIAWWRYWDAVKIDSEKIGPRVRKVSLLGKLVYICMPFISCIYKQKYTNLYRGGR